MSTPRVHVSLPVRDLQASLVFYKALFEREPTKIRDDYANFRMDAPGLHLALVAAGSTEATAPDRHYGIELFDDAALTAVRERVVQAELPHKLEEQVTCCYAVADKVWAYDPDGNAWEFWVRTSEADQMHDVPRPDSCRSTDCCATG